MLGWNGVWIMIYEACAASEKTQVMPGTSPDKLGLICVELKTVGWHPVANFCDASLELTDHLVHINGQAVHQAIYEGNDNEWERCGFTAHITELCLQLTAGSWPCKRRWAPTLWSQSCERVMLTLCLVLCIHFYSCVISLSMKLCVNILLYYICIYFIQSVKKSFKSNILWLNLN